MTSWIQRELFPAAAKEGSHFTAELGEYLMGLFSKTVDLGLNFVRSSAKTEMVPTVDAQLINVCHTGLEPRASKPPGSSRPAPHTREPCLAQSLCSTFISLLDDAKLDLKAEGYLEAAKPVVANLYVFCFVWSIGASLDESVWPDFDDLVREGFAELVKLPPNGDVHDFFVKLPENQLTNWKEMVPEFVYDVNMSYFDMLVPTIDTVRCSFLLERSLNVSKPMLFTGHSGVGKSVVVADTVRPNPNPDSPEP